jgi:aarF domain-containing kinase
VKDVEKQEAMWERQHEFAADKIYAMCSDLGGFFLKVIFLLVTLLCRVLLLL